MTEPSIVTDGGINAPPPPPTGTLWHTIRTGPTTAGQKTTKSSQGGSMTTTLLVRIDDRGHFERYPKARRGPKKEKPKRHYDPEHPHVSVAKILFSRKIKETG